MKNIWILGLLVPFFTACKEKTPANQVPSDLMQLAEENRKLRNRINKNDSVEATFFEAMNEIQFNLQSIYKKEKDIRKSVADRTELNDDMRDRIAADINAIHALMQKNHKKIGTLQRRVQNTTNATEQYKAQLAKMEELLAIHHTEMMALRDEMAAMNIEMDLLYLENEDLIRQLDLQVEEMHTGWYAMGTRKELEEKNVITKEGGFMGIGKTEKMRNDFNEAYFTRIHIAQEKNIPLGYHNVKLITPHPDNSYEFIGTNPVEQLVIKDEQAFWKASRYLVIALD